MKNLIQALALIFISIFIFGSCQSKKTTEKQHIGILNEGDCKLTSATYDFENVKINIQLTYNEDNLVSEVNRYTNDYKERVTNLHYNDEGKIIKTETYHDDTLTYFNELVWQDDICINSLYQFENNEWSNKNKIALNFDSEGQLILLDDYSVDSNNVWSAKGTLYDYTWENNNVSTITNYIVVEDTVNARDMYHKTQEPLLVNIDHQEYILDTYSDLKTFYTSTIEYYDTPNPFYHLSIAQILAPNDFNCSKYSIKEITKTYTSGEVIEFVYSYTNNEKGYPIKVDVEAQLIDGSETLNKKYTMQFEYENCQ
jgi:hypothetical protein